MNLIGQLQSDVYTVYFEIKDENENTIDVCDKHIRVFHDHAIVFGRSTGSTYDGGGWSINHQHRDEEAQVQDISVVKQWTLWSRDLLYQTLRFGFDFPARETEPTEPKKQKI